MIYNEPQPENYQCMDMKSCVAQIENEFGSVGPNDNYMRHLLNTARASLGSTAIIYTTDPPPYLAQGTVAGEEEYRCRHACAVCHACHKLMSNLSADCHCAGAAWWIAGQARLTCSGRSRSRRP